MLNTYPLLERVAARARAAPDATAITDAINGIDASYARLAADVLRLAQRLAAADARTEGLREARVALLVDKGYLAALGLLAIWAAGGLVVPVLSSLPLPEQAYLVNTADCALILVDKNNRTRAEQLVAQKDEGESLKIMEVEVADLVEEVGDAADVLQALAPIDGEARAMMLFTSGTTGRPKGAVTRHSSLAAQVSSTVQAWRWTESDNLLHILPLNHLHGIAVGLLPTLWAGASVELWDKFDADKVWARWINGAEKAPITMFFFVPTGYSRLIAAHRAMTPEQQAEASAASAKLRLQVSGSAPLPVSVKSAWENGIGGGQVILERYGMTETGLIAGTGWENEKRVKGCVGFAFPGMEIRLWDPVENVVITGRDVPGDIEVRGPQVTKEYWRNPEATTKEFRDGWFRTGDVGIYSGATGEEGMLKILGRASVDIIKSGGEKLSAVEIERAILELPGMKDVAVVGIPDEEWGQIVGAVIVTEGEQVELKTLRDQLRSELAAYKLPRRLKVLDAIPRNGMGKVQKKLIVEREFS
ncbi:hypothetical protein CcaverHIS002_0400220 [Cutaneotrichosporon cavernicola]|uniref:Acetyl-CoA synthetase-like protein n=1 Tax=Cutaneotrichosporon cavernicola TaxID=279322 RepID=A0AA48QVG2_9TREE|nr:uncharacterized protein CcaverHIS019_0400220 [Cutaneotrichosporon cavernicola]BEI83418.1 hypothetical protein CcaverHIS002_0400220 [Cutaneotrichosporon cavernicola]BEI91202.1 hypothetical protein CcaverHIS019_0400220 [Cutaneotrichosporon cavernicola]BEI98975.1 hypothetical protein CcaverHIS631_0400180 [Cutaneotrichosporon cavernicola]BEJ06749.1 hypothetical protein CcaverHIS641_0400180 [Cutaneotrichosporon cavernicola]